MSGSGSTPATFVRRLAHLMRHRPSYVLGRFATVRDAYSRLNGLKDVATKKRPLEIGDLYRPPHGTVDVAPSGCFTSTDAPDGRLDELRRYNYALGPDIAASYVEALVEAARTSPLHFNDRDIGTYETLTASPEQRARIAIATVRDSSNLTLVRRLAGDRMLYDVAARFLGYRPRQVSSWLFWSLANRLSDDERRSASQTIDYHYDVDGFNFLYANFYLLDTNADNGAHALVVGSSRRKRLKDLLAGARLGDAEVRAIYGTESERLIEGPAGSGFMEDASCYHKALAPKTGDRLMLQLRYR